jgi:hypothetical protein
MQALELGMHPCNDMPAVGVWALLGIAAHQQAADSVRFTGSSRTADGAHSREAGR